MVCKVVLFSLLLLCGPTHGQTTLNVPSPAYPSIQAAIIASQNGDTVAVALGIYAENLNFLGKAITVQGTQGAAATTLQGNGSTRVVSFVSGEVAAAELRGFTIQGGKGGIICENSSPTIRDCVITSNSAGNEGGGGVLWKATLGGIASPVIDACVISGNFSNYRGGGLAGQVEGASGSTAVVTNCCIEGNISLGSTNDGKGGAGINVWVVSGGMASVSLEGCAVRSNSCVGSGGGIGLFDGANAILNSCRIQDNYSGGDAGGLYGEFGSVVALTGCILTGNVTTGGGGAIRTGNGTLSLNECTVASNWGNFAAGILAGSVTNVVNSVIWGNVGGVSITANSPSDVVVSYSNVHSGLFTAGPGNVSVDPLFVDPDNGDWHLAAYSPCVDAGDPATIPTATADMDGTPRIQNGLIDMGADEVPIASFPGTSEDLEIFTWIDGGGDPLASAITGAAGEVLGVELDSPGETFTGAPPLLLGQIYVSGSPPAPFPGLSALHLDPFAAFVVAGNPAAAPFTAAGLPQDGLTLMFQIPPGFLGLTLRLQGAVLSTFSANGSLALTAAHDVQLQ